MKYFFLGDIANVKTGKYDANHGNTEGPYKFYTCAFDQCLAPTFSFEGEAIVLPGNGANVGEVFFNKGEKFEAYQRTYVVTNINAHVPYVYYYFKSFWKNSLLNTQFGSATNYIRLSNLTKFKILLPVLSEQKRIAQVLSNCESLIQKRKESIELLDELLKSTFLEMFGDPLFNPFKYKKECLENIANFITGYPFKSKDYTEDLDSIRLCGGLIIQPGFIDWNNSKRWPKTKTKGIEEYFLKADDIVIAMDRPWISSGFKIGRIKETNLPTLLVQRTARIRAEKINQEYLFYCLKDRAFAIHSKPTETTVPHISPKDIKKFLIPLPPKELQDKFATVVKKVETLKEKFQSHLKELENLYGSISQKAFKGELDLSEVLLHETKYFPGNTNETPEDFIDFAKKKGDEIVYKKVSKKDLLKHISDPIKKRDITDLSLADYYGIPLDIQAKRENIEFDFISDDLFYQFLLKDTFNKEEKFTSVDIFDKLNNYFYSIGDLDYDHETWKNILFKFLEAKPPLLEQIFDKTDNTVKLKLTDEAFKA